MTWVGTEVGKSQVSTMTAVVDGIVRTETVDGTTAIGTIAGESGKLDGDGRLSITAGVRVIGTGRVRITVVGKVDGKS